MQKAYEKFINTSKNINIDIKTYNKFLNYFYDLDDKEKEQIILNCAYKKDYIYKLKNHSFDKIYLMYLFLIKRLKNKSLTNKEVFIYEIIISTLIKNNIYNDYNNFLIYMNNYFNITDTKNINSKLYIISYDIIEKLNNNNNSNVNIVFDNTIPDYAIADFLSNIKIDRITINLEKYIDTNYTENVKNGKLLNIYIAYLIFIILHEYKHILQKNYMQENDNELSNKIEYELIMVEFFNKFYRKYHNYILIEKDANEYAFKHMDSVMKEYVNVSSEDIKDLIIELKRIIKAYNLDSKTLYTIKYNFLINVISILKRTKIKQLKKVY